MQLLGGLIGSWCAGQGIVAFARGLHNDLDYALKFYVERSSFLAESEMYRSQTLGRLLPQVRLYLGAFQHTVRARAVQRFVRFKAGFCPASMHGTFMVPHHFNAVGPKRHTGTAPTEISQPECCPLGATLRSLSTQWPAGQGAMQSTPMAPTGVRGRLRVP